MSDRITIVVVDDHPLFRQGVVSALQQEPDFQVVGETDSGEQALQLARTLMPQVMLLDVSMTGWNGITTAEKVSIACPATAIVMLTVSDDKDRLLAAFKAGARAYVLKGVSAQELARVVRAAAAGEVYVSQSLAGEMLVSLTQGKAPDPLQ
jgi:DNA-binding NarL/FixJ family response regulator